MIFANERKSEQDDVFLQDRHDDIPVDQPMAARMNIALLINDDQKVWIVYDKPMDAPMMWAEYDADTASLALVSQSGRINDLGMKIHTPFRKHLREAREIYTVYMKDKKVRDAGILPLMVRETGIYHA